MRALWRTRNGLWHLRLGLRHLRRLLGEERWRENAVDLGRTVAGRLGSFDRWKRLGQRLGLVSRVTWDASAHSRYAAGEMYAHLRDDEPGPATAAAAAGKASSGALVLLSACVDARDTGGARYSGGLKQLNTLTDLLRRHGHEAFMVTYDGEFEPWLVNHQPTISLREARERLAGARGAGRPVRCVTSYAIARAFLDVCPEVCFWDMELALTDNHQFPEISRLYVRGKVRRAAGISRTIQAWHLARFAPDRVTLLPPLQDETIYRSDPSGRVSGRVGFMNEGDHSERYAGFVADFARRRGVEVEMFPIRGAEQDYVSALQTCDFYLSMNLGKDLRWGEGCPLTVGESMGCGAVLLAFDVIGNREMILPGHNALLLPRYRVDHMAAELVRLRRDADTREWLRANAAAVLADSHRLELRWPAVREFLDLPGGLTA